MDGNRYYAPPPGIERPLLPQVIFNLEKPTFNEFWKIVKRKRNSSSPGINGNSYSIYKSSKKIAYLLWELLCFIWEKCEVPKSWILAWIKLLEKKDGCLPRRYETNLNFECGRANLFLFGRKKNECLHDSERIHQKMATKSFHGRSCRLYRTQYFNI